MPYNADSAFSPIGTISCLSVNEITRSSAVNIANARYDVFISFSSNDISNLTIPTNAITTPNVMADPRNASLADSPIGESIYLIVNEMTNNSAVKIPNALYDSDNFYSSKDIIHLTRLIIPTTTPIAIADPNNASFACSPIGESMYLIVNEITRSSAVKIPNALYDSCNFYSSKVIIHLTKPSIPVTTAIAIAEPNNASFACSPIGVKIYRIVNEITNNSAVNIPNALYDS